MKLSNKTLAMLLGAVLLLAAVLAGARFLRPTGSNVRVTVNGREYGTYPLYRNATVTIAQEGGNWHNTLVIQNGAAGITESDCDNQVCVHTPALTENTVGVIVCLPHGVVVELTQ